MIISGVNWNTANGQFKTQSDEGTPLPPLTKRFITRKRKHEHECYKKHGAICDKCHQVFTKNTITGHPCPKECFNHSEKCTIFANDKDELTYQHSIFWDVVCVREECTCKKKHVLKFTEIKVPKKN